MSGQCAGAVRDEKTLGRPTDEGGAGAREEALRKFADKLAHLEKDVGLTGVQARVIFEQAAGDEARSPTATTATAKTSAKTSAILKMVMRD